MKKALLVIFLLLAVFAGAIFLFEKRDSQGENKPFIAVSSFPLYEIASKIIDQEIDIVKLIPFGVEVHTYMPSVKTMQKISDASLFVYNGVGMEPWINKQYPNGIDMSRKVHLLDACHEEDEHEEHGHHHDDVSDPHYWLDIDNMIIMTQSILEELNMRFPTYKEQFTQRANAYIYELKVLKVEYQQGLAECQRREIVVNHDAFAYLGKAYSFHSHAVMGLSPDEQASAKRMREVSDLVKEEGIDTIFFESFVSDKVAQTIARETGAKALALQPLANVTDKEASRGYIALMRENLEKLRRAMRCR